MSDFSEFFEGELDYTDFPNCSDLLNYRDFLNCSGLLNNTDFLNFSIDGKTTPCRPIPISDAINVAVCVFYILVFLLAIPGNLTVGLLIFLNRQTLSPSEVYLFHLMLADTLLAFILPFYATAVVRGWLFGDSLCKMVSLAKEASFYASILFLVCISVDRYMVIVRAMETRKAQRRVCSLVVCCMVWLLGFLLSLPALYNETFSLKGSEVLLCAEHFELNHADEWRLATRIMRHLLGFLLPLVVMLVCYSVTVARLLRTRGFQRQKAMRVIVAVVLAFLLCWTPFHIATIADTLLRAKLLENSCARRNAVDLAMFATQSLGLLHCCVNPVLYAFVAQKFRSRFTQMLQKSGLRERSSIYRPNRNTSQSSDATPSFF